MRVLYVLMVFMLGSCVTTPTVPKGFLTPAQLNASKHQYDGKLVRVQGWMRVGFESYALWESKESEDSHSFLRNCVSLMIPKSMRVDGMSGHYVQVEAVFLEKLPQGMVQVGGCNLTRLQLMDGGTPVRILRKQ